MQFGIGSDLPKRNFYANASPLQDLPPSGNAPVVVARLRKNQIRV
jgi:hypothetical protein